MLIALGLDRWFGEPPARLHPVVAMGQYLSWAGRGLPTLTPRLAFAAGTAAWWAGALVVGVLAHMLDTAARHIASPHGLVGSAGLALLLGLALKPMLAWRMLREEVQAVEHALTHSLDAGRAQVAGGGGGGKPPSKLWPKTSTTP
jgi:adenosylcobinamide-phosphate synthase